MKLSGQWLWPPSDEVEALVGANVTEHPVETVMRLRALTEISRKFDSRTLAALASLAHGEAPDAAKALAGRRRA
jgi:hypothetical protein